MNVIGQARAKEILKRAIRSNHLAHAYLLYGPEGVGKDALAIELARTLVCERQSDEACGECSACKKMEQLHHPNVSFICALPIGKNEKAGDDPIEALNPDQVVELQEQLRKKGRNPYHRIFLEKATSIKVNSVRQIRRGASLTATEQGKKVFIISDAEKMTAEAANSLLKTLEEPPPNTMLILTSSHKEQLLPTIISRCQVIQCEPLSDDDIANALHVREGVEPERARLVARLAGGSYTKAIELTSVDVVREQQLVVTFMRYALKQSKEDLISLIEEQLAPRRPDAIIRWLTLLQAWLRDAILLREQLQDNVQSYQSVDDLARFVKNFPHADLPAAIRAVERSIALVDKNSYLMLVLVALATDLYKYSYAESLFSYR